ncbi:Transmembrane inner ear expressed protein [Frankliniella fusca]|uniref:Transmembrane inner ear expressed protein n=1 Tax=Frankliniella fusca TaxID=407009 RepID=A0AAE1GZQ4_9NEOP|nr:Transmembrane inner ear expressed protein [Frankliniella fusca]
MEDPGVLASPGAEDTTLGTGLDVDLLETTLGDDLADCALGGLNCSANTTLPTPPADWVESEVFRGAGIKVWHVLFMIAGAFCALVIVLCCCIRFRIPRTKQEIEADYVRKQITRKFQKQLRRIRNADMDDMDLKRALDRVRAEFKSDTESLAQSISSSANASVCNSPGGPGARGETYRKASDIGVSIEDLIERRNSGLGARFSTLVGTLGRLRPRRGSTATVDRANGAAGEQPSNLRDARAEP